jgi:Xaa-Pro dipeptidase
MLADVLVEQGLVRCSADAAFDRRITDVFFPHGLGHLIGLQTHDVAGHMVSPEGGSRPPPERYPALRLTRTIEAGHVFTVEPGLYFIPMLLRQLRRSTHAADVDWARVERLLPCGGIRIEDNVHVTRDGVENLTRDAFAA